MIAVDVMNPVEVREAGLQALNDVLGPDVTRVFINQYFGGIGDYTKEKYEEPDLTEAEFNEIVELAKAETEQRKARIPA